MAKQLIVLLLASFALACGVTSELGLNSPTPSAVPSPTTDPTSALVAQVQRDLSHPRPVCQAGTHNEKEWSDYGQTLGPALGHLFSDARARAISPTVLASIFQRASGLALAVSNGSGNDALVTIVGANCNNRIGGGDSPAAPRDYVYVTNRAGGLWQIGHVADVLDATWSQDHWIVLVTKAEYGSGLRYEAWVVTQDGGNWNGATVLQFSQLFSAPLPRLGNGGATITVFSQPAACGAVGDVPSNSTVESVYAWQEGTYHCRMSSIVPDPSPTPGP